MSSFFCDLAQILNDRRKTNIVAITRRCSTIDQDPIEHTRSAPASPALNHHGRQQRSSENQISLDPIDNVSCTSSTK